MEQTRKNKKRSELTTKLEGEQRKFVVVSNPFRRWMDGVVDMSEVANLLSDVR